MGDGSAGLTQLAPAPFAMTLLLCKPFNQLLGLVNSQKFALLHGLRKVLRLVQF